MPCVVILLGDILRDLSIYYLGTLIPGGPTQSPHPDMCANRHQGGLRPGLLKLPEAYLSVSKQYIVVSLADKIPAQYLFFIM